MPRYIDADALREEINSLSITLCGKELFGELAKYSVLQKIDEAPTADVTDINDGHKSEWISVDERLPETEGKYLVCTTNGNIGVGSFIDYYGKGTRLCFDCWAVTHWMPLPEPPKGAVNDKQTHGS